jgi:hypothetical protein
MYPKTVDDQRRITASMLAQMVKNYSSKTKYPVAVGHDAALGYWSDATKAAGSLTNLRVRESDDTLLGDVDLRGEVDNDYKDNAYPGWSLGIFKTKKRGWEVDHLALLGSVGAAFKDLEETHNFSARVNTRDYAEVKVSEDKTILMFRATPRKGDSEMNEEEKKAFEALKAENEKLKKDLEEFATARENAKREEFASITEALKKSAEAKGLNEDVRKSMFENIASLEDAFVSGAVNKGVFDSFAAVIDAHVAPVKPGEVTDPQGEDVETEKPKETFSGREAVDCLY